MSRKHLSVNDKQKMKMKKNAMDYVNFEEEKIKDPKYKTELCKSWIETGFCVYGNKCRFAHGDKELVAKINTNNYKKKLCKSFKESGICLYGPKCNFKHFDKRLCDLKLPYYFSKLFIQNEITLPKRLQIFEDICNSNTMNQTTNENWSVSTCSDDTFLIECSNRQGKEFEEMELPLESVLRFMI